MSNQHITCAGGHYGIGYSHGRRCSNAIGKVLEFASHIFLAGRIDRGGDILRAAGAYRAPLSLYCPHLLEELDGVAKGAGKRPDEILFLHVRTELSHYAKSGCSAFAVAPHRTRHGGMLAGQNWDNVPWYGGRMIVLELRPADKPAILMLTFPGVIGYIGINETGVSVWDNQLMCDGWKMGVPHYFLKRMILEQESVEGVIGMLRSVEPASSENFVVTDGTGRIASIECTPHGIEVIEGEDGIVAHTNHFLAPAFLPLERYVIDLPDTCDRLARLRGLFRRFDGNVSVETMKSILADHVGFPRSLCRHSDHSPHSMATCASVIAEPAAGRMHVAHGTPCTRAYKLYELSGKQNGV